MSDAPKVALERSGSGRTFVYETAAFRVAVACRGRVLTIPYSTLHERGAYAELERIADAWWALADEAGIERIEIAYRMGDPYETFTIRPTAE